MNSIVLLGTFYGDKKNYFAKNGSDVFSFDFVTKWSHIDIYCTRHPSFNGRSSNPQKTHLFRSGKLCFVKGKEPTTKSQAENLAAQWAEYFLEYRRTGKVQN